MIIAEFYDKYSPIRNVVSTIANKPERLILIGDGPIIHRQLPALRGFLVATGNSKTEIEVRPAPEHDLPSILQTIEAVIHDYPDCSFDLTGGDELFFTAAGILYERHREADLRMHQYNIRTGVVYDCDHDGIAPSDQIPPVTVSQFILLHGGKVQSAEDETPLMAEWKKQGCLESDVEAMWRISAADPSLWNSQLALFNQLLHLNTANDPLVVNLPRSALAHQLQKPGRSFQPEKVLLPMYHAGLLTEYTDHEENFRIRCKNKQVLHCLEKAGTVLELKVYLSALQLKNEDGGPLFPDVSTGVFIDWDGRHDPYGPDTENEIDVLLMQGLVPVFISCKNGGVTTEELYKLDTVARRFGGDYAKKYLIGADLEQHLGSTWRAFHQRASDMDITILPDAASWSDVRFAEVLSKL